ncbi:MAG: hypothetical protein M3X11_20125 [Acidobacteriota bacterium]|nr:hypothetical protein [Acidobacteriota bacterium]
MKHLSFSEEHHYKDDDAGIPVAVTLFYADSSLGSRPNWTAALPFAYSVMRQAPL